MFMFHSGSLPVAVCVCVCLCGGGGGGVEVFIIKYQSSTVGPIRIA